MKGNEFSEIRKRMGLRQHEIANVFKVSRETVVRWETKEGGYGEVPLLASEALLRLESNPDQIEAIKVLRPPRRIFPYEERIARKIQRIRKAGEKEDDTRNYD